jgi:hypothetical protein
MIEKCLYILVVSSVSLKEYSEGNLPLCRTHSLRPVPRIDASYLNVSQPAAAVSLVQLILFEV